MAEKRMFTQKIIDSDAFLTMPLSAQALYFHLNMRADDDGFVNNPRKIAEWIHASDDDLRLLLAKRFLIGFESGVIVIKHWRMHNTLKSDRYHPTDYQEEFALLDIKPNKAYTEKSLSAPPLAALPPDNPDWNQDGSKSVPNRFQSGTTGLDIGLGLDKTKNNPPISPQGDERFDRFWAVYPKKVGKGAARKSFAKAVLKCSVDDMITAVEKQKQSIQWTKDDGQFIPNPATWLNQERWDDRLDEKGSAPGGVAAGSNGRTQSKWNLHYDNDERTFADGKAGSQS